SRSAGASFVGRPPLHEGGAVMNKGPIHDPDVAGTVIRLLVVVNAMTFLIFALLHLGVRLHLGSVVVTTGRIIPATVVEGLAGILFAVATWAVFVRASWAWSGT